VAARKRALIGLISISMNTSHAEGRARGALGGAACARHCWWRDAR